MAPLVMALMSTVMGAKQAKAAEKQAKKQALLDSYLRGAQKYGAPTESIETQRALSDAEFQKQQQKSAALSQLLGGIMEKNAADKARLKDTMAQQGVADQQFSNQMGGMAQAQASAYGGDAYQRMIAQRRAMGGF
jgi:cytochrome P450